MTNIIWNDYVFIFKKKGGIIGFLSDEISGLIGLAGGAVLATAAVPVVIIGGSLTTVYNYTVERTNAGEKADLFAKAKPEVRTSITRILNEENIDIPRDEYASCLLEQATEGYLNAVIGNRYRSNNTVPKEFKPWPGFIDLNNIKVPLSNNDIPDDQITFEDAVGKDSLDTCEVLAHKMKDPEKDQKLRSGIESLFLKATFTSKDNFNYKLSYLNWDKLNHPLLSTVDARLSSLNMKTRD